MTEMEIRSTSVETPQGQLLRFESEMRMGPSPSRTTGQVRRRSARHRDDGCRMRRRRGLRSPGRPTVGGPFAAEQTLLREPMQPGERRTLKMLMIGLQPGGRRGDDRQGLRADRPARAAPTTLLRIETVTRLADGQKIEGTVWTDRTGETLKTDSQAMGLETYRASKAEALEKADVAELDLLASTMVKVDRPLPHAHQTKQVRYRVHLGGRRSGERFRHRAHAGGQVDRRPHGRDHGLRDPAGPAGRQPRRAGRSAHRRRPPAQQLHPERRSAIVADAEKAAGDETDPGAWPWPWSATSIAR